MGMSFQRHGLELPGIVVVVGPMLNPFESRDTEPQFIFRSAANEQLGPFTGCFYLPISLHEKWQVPMQRRIAGHMPPKKIWLGQRRVQDELTSDRVSEYDSSVGAGPVGSFNKR